MCCDPFQLFLATQASAVRSCCRVFMLPGLKYATSLSVFVILYLAFTHHCIGVIMFCSGEFCFLDLKFPALLCHCVPMLHISESVWNGNFFVGHIYGGK